MDLGILKSLIPLVLAAGAITVALVKVKSKGEQTAQDTTALRKDVDRLEASGHDTTQLKAQMIQVEKNITKLWAANEGVQAREDKARDRLDERFIQLRDRFSNGQSK